MRKQRIGLMALGGIALALVARGAEPSHPDGTADWWFQVAEVPHACAENTRLVETDKPEGRVRACLDRLSDQHGWSVGWYPEGGRRFQCQAVHGRLQGVCLNWHPNGTPSSYQEYNDGLRHGRLLSWFADGQPELSGTYLEGERDGLWSGWYDTGRLRLRGEYRQGHPVGPFEYRMPDGTEVRSEFDLVSACTRCPKDTTPRPSWEERQAERRKIPPILSQPRVLVGGPFLKRQALWADEQLGQLTDIAHGEFDGSAGRETLVAGRRGAVLLPDDGGAPRLVKFETGGQRVHILDVEGDGRAEYLVEGRGFNHHFTFPLLFLLSSEGQIRWRLAPLGYWAQVAAGDLDGDGQLEFAIHAPPRAPDTERQETDFDAIGIFDASGRELARWPAPHTDRLFLLDTDGDGRDEVVAVNRHNQIRIFDRSGRQVFKANTGENWEITDTCRWPADGPRRLLFHHETRGALVDPRRGPVAWFDAPLAQADWTEGIHGQAVRLRADREPYLALTLALREEWGRSLLVVAAPDGRVVYQEVLALPAAALTVRPGRPGEEELLLAGGGEVWAYRFDHAFYLQAFQRVWDVFHGQPEITDLLPIAVSNVAAEEREGSWEWTVFLEGPPAALERIACVQYTLPDSFPDPVRMVCERGVGEQAFAHTSGGWGTFDMPVRVFLKDGPVQEMRHRLRFR